MVQLKSYKNLLLFLILASIQIFIVSCKFNDQSYNGNLKFEKHSWLNGKKIFIDPGHGGKGKSDRFRIGPNGITEENINLKVALILEHMLIASGAQVKMSRHSNSDVSMETRIKMIPMVMSRYFYSCD